MFFFQNILLPLTKCHTVLISRPSYQLMLLEDVTHLSNLADGSRPALSVHSLHDAAPGGPEQEFDLLRVDDLWALLPGFMCSLIQREYLFYSAQVILAFSHFDEGERMCQEKRKSKI